MRTLTTLVACLLLAGPLMAAADPAPRLPPLPVRLLPGTDASLLENLVNVRLVKGQGPVTLQLDIAHKRILDAQGRMVVEVDGRNPIALQGAIDKWRYVQALASLAAAHRQNVYIDPGSLPAEQQTPPLPRIYNGQGLIYVVPDVPPQRQVIIFNIDARGGVQLLYVRDSAQGATDTVAIQAYIRPLFGVEHLVAISAVDPVQVRGLVAWLAETWQASGMIDSQGSLLQQIAALKDVRVGMVAVYTCESRANCSR